MVMSHFDLFSKLSQERWRWWFMFSWLMFKSETKIYFSSLVYESESKWYWMTSKKKGWEMNERLKDICFFLHALLLFEKLQIYWLHFYYSNKWNNNDSRLYMIIFHVLLPFSSYYLWVIFILCVFIQSEEL